MPLRLRRRALCCALYTIYNEPAGVPPAGRPPLTRSCVLADLSRRRRLGRCGRVVATVATAVTVIVAVAFSQGGGWADEIDARAASVGWQVYAHLPRGRRVCARVK